MYAKKREVKEQKEKLLEHQDDSKNIKVNSNIESKLSEKSKLVELFKKRIANLERQLMTSRSETSGIKKILELERQERQELENRALNLIKNAKRKWENTKKDKQTIKIAELSASNNEMNIKLQKAESELKTLKAELIKLRNFQGLSLQSAQGVENNLKQMTTRSHNQLAKVWNLLELETSMGKDLENKLYNKQNSHKESGLNIALEEAKSELKDCREQLKSFNETIFYQDQKLEEMKNELVMKTKQLENDVINQETFMHLQNQHKIIISKNEKLQNQLKIAESNFRDTSINFENAKQEKENLELQLRASLNKEEEQLRKINNLEELFKRLQDSVSELEAENGILKEMKKDTKVNTDLYQMNNISQLEQQIQNLEYKLEAINENLLAEQRKTNEMQMLLLKKEKELSDSNFLSIKTLDEKLKIIEEEKIKLMEKLKKKEKEEEDKFLKLLKEIENAKVSLVELSIESENDKVEADSAKKALTESNKKINELQHSNAIMQRDLDVTRNETRESQCRVDSLKAANEHLKLQISKQNDMKNEYENKFERLKEEINGYHINDVLLKETCSLLEEQLTDYERLTNDLETQKIILVQENSKFKKNLETLKSNIQECEIMGNKEKTMREIAEKAIVKLESKISDIENERDNLVGQRDEYKVLAQKLNEQIAELSLKCGNLKDDLSQMKQLFDLAKKETQMIKEENSQHLSRVYELKELNMNLISDLQENSDQFKELKMRINEREDVNEMRQFCREREIKAEVNCQKIEESNKKKKGVYNKIFSLKRKENIPPNGIPVNYHELENQSKGERAKVKELMKQINKKITLFSPAFSTNSTEKKYNFKQTENTEHLKRNFPFQEITNNDSFSTVCNENLPKQFELKNSLEILSCCKNSIKNLLLNEPDIPERDTDYLHNSEKTLVEGWVKIADYTKFCWKRKYLKLMENNLYIYDDVPNSETKTISYLNLSERNDFLISKVNEMKIPGTSKNDLLPIIKIELNPTSYLPAQSLEIMTSNQLDRKKWLKSLLYVSKKTTPLDKYQSILKLEKHELNLNCILEIEEGVLLLGTEEGLYIYHWLQAQLLTVIRGVKNVYQLSLHPILGLALMIAGEDRQLVSCDIRQLNSINSLSVKSSDLQITTNPILTDAESCHLYQVGEEILCAATSSNIILLKWNLNEESCEFIRMREFNTQEPCSCVLFIKNIIIMGCNKFFQIDTTTYEIKDFPEKSNFSQIDSATKLGIFPISVLDVSNNEQNVEILLCYNEFGIFVNEYGQRTRYVNLNWTHLPFAFALHAPYLFVVHFSSVEIIKIDPDSLKLSSKEPERTFLKLNNPRYLGLAGNGIYVSTVNFILELLKIEGNSLTPRLSGSQTSIDSLSKNEDDVSDFSIMSNLTDILDGRGRQIHFNNNDP